MPERHCSLPVHGLQEPETHAAPGEQSRSSRQPRTGSSGSVMITGAGGGRTDEAGTADTRAEDAASSGGTCVMTGAEDAAPGTQTTQGKPLTAMQEAPFAEQNRSPPRVHSLPTQTPPIGTTAERAEEREETAGTHCPPRQTSPPAHCASDVQKKDGADERDETAGTHWLFRQTFPAAHSPSLLQGRHSWLMHRPLAQSPLERQPLSQEPALQ